MPNYSKEIDTTFHFKLFKILPHIWLNPSCFQVHCTYFPKNRKHLPFGSC